MKTAATSPEAGIFRRLTWGYVRFSHARPWLPLIFIALTAWAGIHVAKNLRIDTDLRVLLPKGTPSKEGIEEAERRKGSTDFFTIAMEAPSIEAVARFQKAVAESLEKWPEAVWVQYDQDRSFFEKRALLYLPTSELTDLRERVRGMIGEKFASANPLIESLDEEAAAKPSLEGWPNPEALRRQGLPEDIVSALLNKVRRGSPASPSGGTAMARRSDSVPPRPDSLEARLMGWHAEKGVWVGVVLAQLNQPSTNALFAKAMYDKGTGLIERLRPENYGSALWPRWPAPTGISMRSTR